MNQPIHLCDVVALKTDLPDHGLTAGQVGTAVERLDEQVFEVEFSDDQGVTYAMAAVPAEDLLVLRYAPSKVA
jgi:hypothetical protein